MNAGPVVIVGGGLAGASAAEALRDRGYDGEVILLGVERHLPYERPPLSKSVLLGDKEVGSAYVHDQTWWRDHDIDVRTGVEVHSVDLAGRRVVTSAGEQPYEWLVLATGSEPRHLRLADEADAPVHYLRTVEDSLALKDSLTDGAKVAIVGAGWIGLEVASAARAAKAHVTVYETADLPLLAVLGPEVAQHFADLHTAHDVDLRLGAAVSSEDLSDADVVVVGIGAAPRTELAEAAGLAVDDGVLVDELLRTSDDRVLAIGDIANQQHPVLGRRVRVEHWDNAIGQGKAAAATITGAAEPYAKVPYFFTDQYDFGMEYFGHTGPAGYDRVQTRGDFNGPFRAWWIRDDVVVAAMQANDWDASDETRAIVGQAPPPD
ncbi:FAD-dependent pyridine nucleotide-disulfide oxidoreductase [Knoellia sinensis KCTC 19936]|uniref:FAD-dependent pyridine nucleotide-disulfide oxidoreductase n=1 Tax=Knoellia sinensis KCTC 19936 TaxID=1385520 RepID=A0A0A0JBA2_9MICO|nr:FAD-dependent oxidoreductase [Knoellia sinensis]KGN33302.1 FAD-dependent pyridine nucleotide-disulfide oxidoreductase [Knoellia sinensis KCTC 19936]